MSARDDILAGLRSAPAIGDETPEQLADAYRTEVLAKAIGRLRAIPVTCTALVGPAWYGTGWKDCITTLEEIADYQTPDDEAYPGELQRLRAHALAVRVAARKGQLDEVQRLALDHAVEDANARDNAKQGAAPDFFQPGHTYTREHHGQPITFVVRAVSTSPDGQRTVAHGWRTDPYSGWEPTDSDDLCGWTDVTGEAS